MNAKLLLRVAPLLGGLLFVCCWQSLVRITRPAMVLRPVLGLSLPKGERSEVVIVDPSGKVVLRESLDTSPSVRTESIGRLALWIGSGRPTLAVLPKGHPPNLREILERARSGYQGGLEVVVAELSPTQDAVALATTLQRQRAVQPMWLPSPADAMRALYQMSQSGEVLRHAVASLFRVGCGFVLASLVGIPLGGVLGTTLWASRLLSPLIQSLRPISPIAWLPVATLMLGGGDIAAVFLIFLAAVFPISVATAASIHAVEQRYRRVALNLALSRMATVTKVLIPAALPGILTGLRVALGIAWVVVVAAEMLGVESGLGYLVLDGRNQLRYDRVVAAMVVIGLFGLLLDTLLRTVERRELRLRGLRQ